MENSITETYTLKHEESFAIFDSLGNIESKGLGEQGIYYKGTRFLSKYEMFICKKKPLLLSSAIKEDNSVFTVDLTNFDILNKDKVVIPQGSIHIWKSKFLHKNCCYEKVYLKNFFIEPVEIELSFHFESDFADIFEIRGFKRKRRGEIFPPQIKKDQIDFIYKGVDNRKRITEISFSQSPDFISHDKAIFKIKLKPQQNFTFYLIIKCFIEGEKSKKLSYNQALFLIKKRLKKWEDCACKIYTSNEQFNQWLKRSWADIIMLISNTHYGPYPFAGVPWFNTPFGRDGIITALECLWICPEIAKGTLAFLAATQAKDNDPEKDAQPGKIIHEIRKGELATAGEIPFSWYYGSIDATPLFIILAGYYLDRTGDLEFIKDIWPNIKSAIKWIDEYGDLDKDKFIEYIPSEIGLTNKGWKDSEDSVFYKDGRLAKPPIALIEVQGYAYKAKKEAAKIARALEIKNLALKWEKEAEELKEKIDKAFWCEDINFYALALDGEKRPCKVRSSNPGHLLFCEAIPLNKAKEIYNSFFEKHFFSGWGIRTLSSLEKRYNPLSYHNGSIWPHDNAIIAYGLSLYGFKNGTLRILKSLFEASTFFKLHRIPELFCGFPRRANEGPTHYPVACHPQAWAAGSVFLILQACLGLYIKDNIVFFKKPSLPKFLEEVWIKDLKVKNGKVDLYFKKYGEDVIVNVIDKKGEVKIFIEK